MHARAVSAAPLLALAGLTTAAHAQSVGTVTVTTSANTVNVGDTFTIGVYLSDNLPWDSVFAFDVRVAGSGAAFSTVSDSLVIDPTGSQHIIPFEQQLNPDGAQVYAWASDILAPTFDAPLDDLTVFTFQVLATQGGIIHFDPSDGPYEVPGMGQLREAEFLGWMPYDEVVFVGADVTVIPAPAPAALLTLTAPLMLRRRR